MITINIEATLRKLAEHQKRTEGYLELIERILADRDSYSPYFDMFSRKKDETEKRELLLNNANQLFQLIRFMLKHNYLLKRNRLIQLGETLNLYRKIQLVQIDELSLMMDDKSIINRENEIRGELQWQQVFA